MKDYLKTEIARAQRVIETGLTEEPSPIDQSNLEMAQAVIKVAAPVLDRHSRTIDPVSARDTIIALNSSLIKLCYNIDPIAATPKWIAEIGVTANILASLMQRFEAKAETFHGS